MEPRGEPEELGRIDRECLIHPSTPLQAHQQAGPLVFVRGKGVWLTSAEGREYIDGLSCLWNVNVGHGRTEIADAVFAQMRELEFVPVFFGMSHPPVIRLAERLSALSGQKRPRIYFTTTGSEAVETAIKLSRYHWRLRGRPDKHKILFRTHAYHGVTLGALSANGLPAYREAFGPFVPGFVQVPAPHCYRCELGLTYPSCDLACARAVGEAIRREGPDTVAAMLAEPVQGTGGVITPPPEYFPLVAEICRAHEVLLVADEIITGFGRTGRTFAVDHWGVEPDLMTIAKGVSSGYLPLGAACLTPAVYAPFEAANVTLLHGFTYNGHPAACAAALKNLEILETERLVENAAAMGAYLHARLGELTDRPYVGQVRGLGLLAALELVADKATRRPFERAQRVPERVRDAARGQGLLCRAIGEAICLAPPLVITRSEVDLLVAALDRALREVLN
jgi:4-aminobutyrate--pyruvate transaminase